MPNEGEKRHGHHSMFKVVENMDTNPVDGPIIQR